MSFFDTTRPEQESNSRFRRTEFLDLPQGQTIIRIIDTKEEAMKYFVHYVKGVYIKCIGEDCPVCATNKKLIIENPDTFRDIAGYSPKSERYSVNVLDKTPAKICPQCGHPTKGNMGIFSPICAKCDTPIVQVQSQPLNKIKVFSKGRTVADQLNAIDTSIQDASGNSIGINHYDIGLFVQGIGKKQTIAVVPMVEKNEPVDIDSAQKFDLTKTALELSVEEIIDLQKGISLKDILTARRISVPDKELTGVGADTAQSIIDSVNAIMEK